jgi:hypothetical protein
VTTQHYRDGGWSCWRATSAAAEKWRRALECVGLFRSLRRVLLSSISRSAHQREPEKRETLLLLCGLICIKQHLCGTMNKLDCGACVEQAKEERLLAWKYEMCFISLSALASILVRLEIMPSQQISSRKRGLGICDRCRFRKKSPIKFACSSCSCCQVCFESSSDSTV